MALVTVGAFFAILPLAAPLLLAAWGAIVVWPLYQALERRVHRRKGAAALATVLLVLMFLIPLVVVTLSLSVAAADLIQRLTHSKTGADALRAITAGGGGEGISLRGLDPRQAMELARRHGASALTVIKTMFGAATNGVVGAVVFVAGFYVFLVDGKRLYAWLLERSPMSRQHSERFAAVFVESGRGLLVGVGLTALLQGAVATIGYIVIGVPQAFVLGLLTTFAALIPSIGSGLVWVPVTAGLALSGRHGAAIALLVVGIIVSLVDNVVRPFIAKYAKLRLHGLVLFVAMLGGMAAFGAWGLLLGPLFARLASEGLTMLKEARAPAAE